MSPGRLQKKPKKQNTTKTKETNKQTKTKQTNKIYKKNIKKWKGKDDYGEITQ